MREVKPLPMITADWLLARVIERDGCLVWNLQCCNDGKDPRAVVNRRKINVRRAVWAAMHERQPNVTDGVVPCCGTLGCVDPAHMVARSRSQIQTGIPKTFAHKVAIAETWRKKSKLPQEKVKEILQSDLIGKEEAARHGICKSMVNLIRAGKLRRDYSSPFVGLGA